MPVALVVHDLPPGSDAAKVMFEAIFEIAAEHWPVAEGVVLAVTDVSPAYLRTHLLREMTVRGQQPGLILVSRLSETAWANLPAEGEAWLRDVLE
jgi:hypothetical protein